jgi:hypothetical protein
MDPLYQRPVHHQGSLHPLSKPLPAPTSFTRIQKYYPKKLIPYYKRYGKVNQFPHFLKLLLGDLSDELLQLRKELVGFPLTLIIFALTVEPLKMMSIYFSFVT